MTTIYDRHNTAFNNINAYVIAHNTKHGIERLATIAFKRGATGNVKCFFHLIGLPMVQGNAAGGGYDKFSAAFYDAAEKNFKANKGDAQARLIFEAAKQGNGGSHWDNALKAAGLTVLKAV